ncbi:MAG: hypothetical protein Ta2A_08200 [Treponemataceae bacterium]|nr:MAG: hypothetical protein Ta2A_08200 [Treponemataceae bacterium]
MIRYQLFPRSRGVEPRIREIINCFEDKSTMIDSATHTFSSNEVLEIVRENLESIGFLVEQGKTKEKKIGVPVLFGMNDAVDKYFDADALSRDGTIVIEVEAGRAVDNNQFLKDVFQASMMFQVEYLVLAVRNDYRGGDDFKKIYTFLETLYISNRLNLPLAGIVLIGY